MNDKEIMALERLVMDLEETVRAETIDLAVAAEDSQRNLYGTLHLNMRALDRRLQKFMSVLEGIYDFKV